MMNSASGKLTFAQEPIVLENPIKGYRKWYYGLIPVSCIAFMIIGGLGFGLFIGFIIGWALAYMIVNGMAGVRLLKLNFANHPMSALITNEQLYERLGTFAHPDFSVEKGRGRVRFVFKNKTVHTIWIDEKKQTYSVISKFKKKSMITNRHNPGIKEYIHAYNANPIVQNAVNSATLSFKKQEGTILQKT
ncbi:hypothetical protein MHI32_22940 [Paenibacillus sp. FSL H7-0690]|uniref:hypothetical protein n=1 Tax=Paenibacillus sp. FSL H7-0690 TaxID=2921437 RepID=UPI0030EF3506